MFQGLKTGMYYLRTRPAASAIQFTVTQEVKDPVKAEEARKRNEEAMVCSLTNREACESCSG